MTNRQAFLESRKGKLGGTDVAAIVGRNKYRSPLGVYAEKVLGVDPSEDDEKIIAEMGIVLEPLVKGIFGRAMRTPVLDHPVVVHPGYAFLIGNPDGKLETGDLVEIKTHGFSTREEWGEEMSDQIPDAYHVQAIWYLGLTGAPSCYVVAFDRDKGTCRHYQVFPNTEYFEALVTIAVKFWNEYIVAKKEPAASEAMDLAVVRAIYKVQKADLIIATDEFDTVAEHFNELSNLVSDGEKERDGLKARLIQAIGFAGGIITAHGTYTYMPRKDGARVFLKRGENYKR